MNERLNRPFRATAIAIWFVLLGGVLACPRLVSLPDPGDFLIRNTVRISLIYWAANLFCRLRRRGESGEKDNGTERLLWSLACAAFLIHVVMAFEHSHHWSHQSAVRHVEETSGFGPGIFVSYLFTLLWTADVLWWWLAPLSHDQRPRWLSGSWHGFMIFIVFNATVVYETGAIRWVSAVLLSGLLAMWWRLKSAV